MSARIEWSPRALDKFVQHFTAKGFDFSFLMAKVESILTEDHTRAILQGLDKDGISFKPVTYRGDSVAETVRRNKYNRGVGPALQDANGNLTSSQYRKLTGPPLAPRGKNSRIIANFATQSGFDGRVWWAKASLLNVVNKKGKPFMHYHFEGEGQKRRDDRGIRPWGREEIRKALQAEVRKLFKGI